MDSSRNVVPFRLIKKRKKNSENTQIPEEIAIIFSFSGFVFFLYVFLERRDLKNTMFSFFHAGL